MRNSLIGTRLFPRPSTSDAHRRRTSFAFVGARRRRRTLTVVLLFSGCAHVLPANPSTSDRTCDGSATEGSGCTVVACSEKYREFLGTWTGPFASWDRELAAFRPFENTVTYAA